MVHTGNIFYNNTRVRPSIRFLDPPPSYHFVHDHLFFTKFLIYSLLF